MTGMKSSGLARLALLAAMAIAPSAAANAQPVTGAVFTGGSFVRGIGNHDRALHFGGTVEVGSGPVRLGGEAGLVHLPEVDKTYFDSSGRVLGGSSSPAASAGMLGFRASYYPVRFEGRLRPFVTGGLSVYPNEMLLTTLDVGGGVDWWATRNAGIRIEAREQFSSMFTVRVGVVFR